MENQKGKINENSVQNPYCYEDDEIDLYELWLVLKKRWKIIVSTFLIFLLIAGIYVFIATPVYKIETIVKLPIIEDSEKKIIVSPEETKRYLEQLNSFINDKNYNTLAKLLNISISHAKHLKNVSATSNRKDNSIVQINIEYINKDKSFEQSIVPAVINYLNQNPYLKKELDLEKTKLKSFIKETKDKLAELRNMKRLIVQKIEHENAKIIGFNPASIDSLIYGLEISLKEYNSKLVELKGYETSVPTYIPDKPYKPKKALILAVAGVSGLFLGVFLAFFLEWLENVRKRHENLNTGEVK